MYRWRFSLLGLLLCAAPARGQTTDTCLFYRAAHPVTPTDSAMARAMNEITRQLRAPGYDSDSAVEVRIEPSRASYDAGDSIDIRITMRNGAGHAVQVPNMDISRALPLRIEDHDGHEVKPTVLVFGGLVKPGWILGAGQEVTLRRQFGKEWINLREWGYDLKEPGSYTILGPRSSRASITIGP